MCQRFVSILLHYNKKSITVITILYAKQKTNHSAHHVSEMNTSLTLINASATTEFQFVSLHAERFHYPGAFSRWQQSALSGAECSSADVRYAYQRLADSFKKQNISNSYHVLRPRNSDQQTRELINARTTSHTTTKTWIAHAQALCLILQTVLVF